MNQIAEPHGAEQTRERALRRLRDAADEVSRVDRRLQRLVREKPLTMACVALTVGFVVGRLVARL